MSSALICQGTCKSFKKNGGLGSFFTSPFKEERSEVIKGLDFQVGEGEIFGILGPNGSGKSTLIRMIATLLYPDQGRIIVFGNDVRREPLKVRRMINRVSVEASFFKKLSARENLSFAARLYGLSSREAAEKIDEILSRLGFPLKRVSSPMEDLSRGMQQKVAIARALLTSPLLLLLDEPTTGLDPKSKRDVQNFIQELHQQQKTTILLTTHDMVEAERLCHRVALIAEGKFVALDTPEGLKSRLKGKNGSEQISMEDVFFALTGKEMKE